MIVNNTFRATAARLFEEHAREVAAIEAAARPRNIEELQQCQRVRNAQPVGKP